MWMSITVVACVDFLRRKVWFLPQVTLQAETWMQEQSPESCQGQVLKFHFKVRFGFLLNYLNDVKSFLSSPHSFSTLSTKPNSLVLKCQQTFPADSPVIYFTSLSCLPAALLTLQLSLPSLFATDHLWSVPVLEISRCAHGLCCSELYGREISQVIALLEESVYIYAYRVCICAYFIYTLHTKYMGFFYTKNSGN